MTADAAAPCRDTRGGMAGPHLERKVHGKTLSTLPRGMGGEWAAAVQSMRSHAPQFHAIARQHVIDGEALFETLEIRLWRWHESYKGKRYWPLSWTIQPCWQASLMAS